MMSHEGHTSRKSNGNRTIKGLQQSTGTPENKLANFRKGVFDKQKDKVKRGVVVSHMYEETMQVRM